MITVGGSLASRSLRVSPPRMPISSSLTILDPRDEGAHHRQRDVRLQQRDADLTRGRVDVGVGQPALAAQVAQGTAEPVGEGVEHTPSLLNAGRHGTPLRPNAC